MNTPGSMIAAFKVGDLGIFVCTRAFFSYMGMPVFIAGQWYRVTFAVLGHATISSTLKSKCLVSDDLHALVYKWHPRGRDYGQRAKLGLKCEHINCLFHAKIR